ncbi:MAG TPA: DUF2007 domain-containing protein [Roseiflexaceae bacterium]|nr:DUF2007 domain-containing protein [Roseiflexaceae bacterium]
MGDQALPWFGERPRSDGDEQEREAQTDARETTGGGGAGPVCIGVVEGQLRAEMVRSYLEDAGFTVYLQGESVAGVYGLVGGLLSQVRVFVPAAQAEEALPVFEEFVG